MKKAAAAMFGAIEAIAKSAERSPEVQLINAEKQRERFRLKMIRIWSRKLKNADRRDDEEAAVEALLNLEALGVTLESLKAAQQFAAGITEE